MSPYHNVSVSAPARLHMGFIGLNGAHGRNFGSIGIALNEITTTLTVTNANSRHILGPSAQRANRCLSLFCDTLKVPDKLAITIKSAIPEHVGLGSGTQMALAIGSALNAYYELGLSIRDVAAIMDRGLRSGIGIGVFEYGGLVVDGGRGEKTITPPVIVRLKIPSEWRFILAFDKRGQGLHGKQEVAAFATLPAFPQSETERLCHLLFFRGLPALAENDLENFGHVISDLQAAVGKHFAPAQGGIYASPEVAQVMTWLSQQGAVAVGQTSWGPTGFCAVPTLGLAETLVQSAKNEFAHLTNLEFIVVSANNHDGSQRVTVSPLNDEICLANDLAT